MKYYQWSITKFDSAPLGLRLATNIAVLPVLMFNTWDGLEITVGWWTWGFIIRMDKRA